MPKIAVFDKGDTIYKIIIFRIHMLDFGGCSKWLITMVMVSSLTMVAGTPSIYGHEHGGGEKTHGGDVMPEPSPGTPHGSVEPYGS